jgi:purine-binding chemotaxis protein CheW
MAMDPEATSAATEPEHESDDTRGNASERVSYLGFYLGSEIYGLPLEQLREVARVSRLRRVPGAAPGVAGLVNLRGEIMCALDLRAILGLDDDGTPSSFLIALRGFADPIGVLVDSIADIFPIAVADIEPPPSDWAPERSSRFIGTVRVPAGLMGLLDLERVVRL